MVTFLDQAAERRKRIFTKAGVPNLTEVKGARVTALRPLQVGDYGIIVIPNGVMVVRGEFQPLSDCFTSIHLDSDLIIPTVIALYSKTGGKNGKHSSVSESSNISALSYLAVQAFEHMYAQQFRSIPAATAIFQTRQFIQISAINFLTLLDYKGSSQKLEPDL